jgi:hypothetical protein
MNNEKGMVIVYMVILIAVLVAMAGLAVDIGHMYVAKGQLQNAADGAALAAIANLDPSDATYAQTNARNAAFTIASSNRAVGESVKLGLNSNNVETGDIVVGKWENGTFTAAQNAGMVMNAVKVVARRTTEAGDGISAENKQVATFFGKIFTVIADGSAGFPLMSTKSSAVAARSPLATPGIALCFRACNLAVPVRLYLKDSSGKAPLNADGSNGMAWTAFLPSGSPAIGNNSNVPPCDNPAKPPTVQDTIWNKCPLQSAMCGTCITTNNGVGSVIGNNDGLADAFEDLEHDKDNKTFTESGPKRVTSWRVAVPILDTECFNTANTACPPGDQPQSYHVSSVAVITITDVFKGSDPGVLISDIQCTACPTGNPTGNKFQLVQ